MSIQAERRSARPPRSDGLGGDGHGLQEVRHLHRGHCAFEVLKVHLETPNVHIYIYIYGPSYGCGSKLNRRGYAGVGPCFHLPGFHFGAGCFSHRHIYTHLGVCFEGTLCWVGVKEKPKETQRTTGEVPYFDYPNRQDWSKLVDPLQIASRLKGKMQEIQKAANPKR